MLYNIHWRHDRLTHAFTHITTWQEVGEQIFMYTGELQRKDSYVVHCQSFSYRTKTDVLWLVLLHCLHFRPSPLLLKCIHNKVRILGQRGGLFIPQCFLISSIFSHMPFFHNFLPAARDKLRSVVSFFPPITDPRFEVFGEDKHVSIC